jgi:hypothetical protein
MVELIPPNFALLDTVFPSLTKVGRTAFNDVPAALAELGTLSLQDSAIHMTV